MLRISARTQVMGTIQLKLAGRIGPKEVELLRRELDLLCDGETVVLDLSGIEFLDEAALFFLGQWNGVPLVLQGGSLFIRQLLKEYGLKGECH